MRTLPVEFLLGHLNLSIVIIPFLAQLCRGRIFCDALLALRGGGCHDVVVNFVGVEGGEQLTISGKKTLLFGGSMACSFAKVMWVPFCGEFCQGGEIYCRWDRSMPTIHAPFLKPSPSSYIDFLVHMATSAEAACMANCLTLCYPSNTRTLC